jgi:Tfp pilus assembly protein PilX
MSRRLSTRILRAQEGFTMIIAIGVMLVTSLLLVAAFTVANGEVQNSHVSALQKQAYYAALAGVQQYEYLLQANPSYWQTCATPESKVPEESEARYVVTPLVASTAPKGTTKCSTENPFSSMIESKGTLANTFRIKSTGYAGGASKSTGASRSIIATFRVSGFLDYVYYTNYETKDPGLYESSNETLANECRGKYYKEWNGVSKCPAINFITGDHVEGPMHTNDTALVAGGATFGRSGHEPKDVVEMNGGTYGASAGCKSSAVYYTTSGCYITTGPTLSPPPNDTSLSFYVEPKYNYKGLTRIELKGSEMTVITYNEKGAEVKETGVKLPSNGLIYVQQTNAGCQWSFNSEEADTTEEETSPKAKTCGTVYVKGNYSSSLTIAGENNVIVNGSVYPTSVSGKLGSVPSGTAVLGLIASNYVRVYHPCSGGTNKAGSLENPWIYAGILATGHSWMVDNPGCGSSLGELSVYGAIGQNYRGIVGTGGGSTGYLKNYEYDDRLATDEPPYFLAPLKAGWKVVRETAPAPG